MRLVVAGSALALLGDASGGAESAPVAWTAIEHARILSLGPWPAQSGRTRVDATAQRIALGERLFHSARLSGRGGVRCASCHEPFRQFTDGRPRARGLAEGARNTPTLTDVASHQAFGWDGSQDRLDAQSLRPLSDPAEMATAPSRVADLVRTDVELRASYAAAFGAAPQDDASVFADVGRALAAFEATLASARTPFDDWRDALAAGRADAPRLPPAALRGLRVFIGRGACIACHSGPMLGDDRPRVSLVHSHRVDGTPDTGRPGAPANAFRTPALRGVAGTPPYMHDGSVQRLCDAARAHAQAAGDGATPVDRLTASQRDDIAAFLRTLSVDPPPDEWMPCAAA